MTQTPSSPANWTPGASIGTSAWLRLDQARITAFGALTDDLEPLHTDPDWCRAHSPVGRTMAYGFLTLSMLTSFFHEVSDNALAGTTQAASYPLNYGFDRIRFVSPVPVDSRIRAHFTLLERRGRHDGELLRMAVLVEIEGEARPALTAEWLTLWVAGSPAAPAADA
ncbi:MAG: Nodulation protein N [Gemmatimonadaceae bacterium]|nr:Nodulation protein N [Gemmatimonadaceae bacterium]